jgi:hypothetical protein
MKEEKIASLTSRFWKKLGPAFSIGEALLWCTSVQYVVIPRTRKIPTVERETVAYKH